MAKGNEKPRPILFLEKYKVVIDLFSAISALAALVALVFSFIALETARRGTQLQAAGLRPMFQVFYKGQPDESEPPTYSDIRVISPSGTFLDATAELQAFFVVGYTNEPPVGAWEPPVRDLVVTPIDYLLSRDPSPTSDRRGTVIDIWQGEVDVEQAANQWRAEHGREKNRSLASIDFVGIVKISYLDILRQEHVVYYKVGGTELTYSLNQLRASGRAATLDPEVGKKCVDLGKDLGRKKLSWGGFVEDRFRPLYNRLRAEPNRELAQICGK